MFNNSLAGKLLLVVRIAVGVINIVQKYILTLRGYSKSVTEELRGISKYGGRFGSSNLLSAGAVPVVVNGIKSSPRVWILNEEGTERNAGGGSD